MYTPASAPPPEASAERQQVNTPGQKASTWPWPREQRAWVHVANGEKQRQDTRRAASQRQQQPEEEEEPLLPAGPGPGLIVVAIFCVVFFWEGGRTVVFSTGGY
jgi:Tfp pilus assembly protein FimV